MLNFLNIIRRLLFFTFYSLVSRRFYISVLCRLRGIGIMYFCWLCLVSSVVLSTYFYPKIIDYCENDLKSVLNQIPTLVFKDNKVQFQDNLSISTTEAKGFNQNTTIRFDKNNKMYSVVVNSNRNLVIIVNPNNAIIDDDTLYMVSNLRKPENAIKFPFVVTSNLRKPENAIKFPFVVTSNLRKLENAIKFPFVVTSNLRKPENAIKFPFVVTIYNNRFTVLTGTQDVPFNFRDFRIKDGEVVTGLDIANACTLVVKNAGWLFIFLSVFMVLVMKNMFCIFILTLFSLAISKFYGLKNDLVSFIRLSVFANTTPMLIGVFSWFVFDKPELFYTLNGTMITFISLIYIILCFRDFKSNQIKALKVMMENKKNGDSMFMP
ncbi:MAG: DUF1189 family protein [Ruminobacter sp.]|nr:DUF1189 family protein [Ruminobacter sp.]